MRRISTIFEKVYAEAEMLNEMNPKLKALLAAGLIGTAGLGAVSCSMPTDDPYDVQYTIEQPTPEDSEEIEEITDSEDSEEITDSEEIEDSGEIEDSEDSEDFEDPENPVTFETLGVDEYAESLARAKKSKSKGITITTSKIVDGDYNEFRYLNKEYGFIPVEFKNNQYEDGQAYIRYRDGNTHYYVPENMESDFDSAIAAYKTTYTE